MKAFRTFFASLLFAATFAHAQSYIGNYSANPYAPNSTSNPYCHKCPDLPWLGSRRTSIV